MTITWNLEFHNNMFKDKHVLDLACHTGDSSRKIASYGAKSVTGVDIRKSSIEHAIAETTDLTVNYFCNNITDYNFINPLVERSEVIACFGVFYHLFDHFRFLSSILKPNIEYVLLETLHGPDGTNSAMWWTYESTESEWNGWFDNLNTVPVGTPNISWIMQSSKLFGFDIDFLEKYMGNGLDQNQRMVVRLYNSKLFPQTKPLLLEDICNWQNNNLRFSSTDSSINFSSNNH